MVTAIATEEQRFDALLSIQDVTDLTHRLEDHRALRHQMLREVRERQKAEEERRRLEAKIQYAQKLESLGILAGGIAHDFNNLLVGILGNADMALAKAPADSMQRQFLEAIVSSSQRAANLSNQMLAFSGKGKFVTTTLDLGELTRDVVRLLEMSLPDQAKIRFELPPTPLTTVADPTQIRQLLMNLITNASDAVEGCGEIVVAGGAMECDSAYLSASPLVVDLPSGAYVYLDVTDNGPGMSAETIDKVFDPFFTTKFAGRGLGLAAALGIVRGHGGTFRVDSEIGRGTTFRVLLPRAREAAEARPVDLPETELRSDGVVLVIDDEAAVRDVVQQVLEDFGMRVLTAEGGDEGLELFARQADAIALVLLDMTMPGRSGQETLKEIHRIRGDVSVILSSGFSEEVVRDQFGDQMISGFLQKPYHPKDLLAAVRETLEGK